MKNSITLLSLGLTLATAPLLGGCSVDSKEAESEIGSAELLLQGTATSGVVYRLINAEFEIRGPENLVEIPADNATSFQVELPAGSYEIELNDGWSFARVEGDGSLTPVTATLLGANPQPFFVSNGLITHLNFQFETDSGTVVLGDGSVHVTIGITEKSDLLLNDFESPSASNVASVPFPFESTFAIVADGTAPMGALFARSATTPSAFWGGLTFFFGEPLSLTGRGRVSFHYRSTGELFVGFDTVETVPPPAGTCSGACYDAFGTVLPPSATWRYVELPLSDFRQGSWGTVAPSGLINPLDIVFSQQAPNTFDVDHIRVH